MNYKVLLYRYQWLTHSTCLARGDNEIKGGAIWLRIHQYQDTDAWLTNPYVIDAEKWLVEWHRIASKLPDPIQSLDIVCQHSESKSRQLVANTIEQFGLDLAEAWSLAGGSPAKRQHPNIPNLSSAELWFEEEATTTIPMFNAGQILSHWSRELAQSGMHPLGELPDKHLLEAVQSTRLRLAMNCSQLAREAGFRASHGTDLVAGTLRQEYLHMPKKKFAAQLLFAWHQVSKCNSIANLQQLRIGKPS